MFCLLELSLWIIVWVSFSGTAKSISNSFLTLTSGDYFGVGGGRAGGERASMVLVEYTYDK